MSEGVPKSISLPPEAAVHAATVRRVGGLYVLLLIARTSLGPTLIRSVGDFDIAQHGLLAVTIAQFAPLVTGVALACMLKSGTLPSLSAALRPRGPMSFVKPALTGLTINVILAVFGIWPFVWTASDSPLPAVAMGLLSGHNYAAIGLWLLTVGCITPFIEECIFRQGLLGWLQSRLESKHKAIWTTAAIFGAMHLGNLAYIPLATLRNAATAGLFSVALGYLVLFRVGGLTSAIVVHVSRNLLEGATLFLAVSRVGSR